MWMQFLEKSKLDGLTVKWGFELLIDFGLEYSMAVCVDSSGQLRKWFWQGNSSVSAVDLTFKEGWWNLEPWGNLLRILSFHYFYIFNRLERWNELDISTLLWSSLTHLFHPLPETNTADLFQWHHSQIFINFCIQTADSSYA